MLFVFVVTAELTSTITVAVLDASVVNDVKSKGVPTSPLGLGSGVIFGIASILAVVCVIDADSCDSFCEIVVMITHE